MSIFEFRNLLDEFQKLDLQLNHLKDIKKIKNILKVIGIGFFIYQNIDSEIIKTSQRKDDILNKLFQRISESLQVIESQFTGLIQSNDYLKKETETHLIKSLNLLYKTLTFIETEKYNIQNLSNSILNLKTKIGSYNSDLERNKLQAELLALKEKIVYAKQEFEALIYADRYFSKESLKSWREKWQSIKKQTDRCIEKIDMKINFKEEVIGFLNGYKEGLREKRNKEFIIKESKKFNDFFNTIESNPLTNEQIQAILTDETNVLVVAGAGTGKTSTIVGKVGYLLEKGLASPEEILLLSFNKDVQIELEKRIKNKIKIPLKVRTYHSFGLGVIAQATGVKRKLSKLAEDKTLLANKISEFLDYRMKEQAFAKKVNDYFLYYLVPYKSQFDFESFGDYVRYMKQFDIRSLKGDRVKSFEECYIANYLYTNGIEYLYEPDYEVNTATEENRQYRPDFYLPKYKIYIEHFGINREGEPAPFISKDYIRQINWKRFTHQENKTLLIETNSYEQTEGLLLANLEAKLKKKGVEFLPIPSEQIFDNLYRLGKTSQFVDILCSFLNLFKASGKSIQQIESEVDQSDFRTNAFLKIFSGIYEDYTAYLDESDEIDFNDMLNDATGFIKESRYISRFKYILVDEFQDISHSRYEFLNALARNNHSKLFCVGDDWQSIYRFTGSDISLMVDFQKNLEFSECLFLQKTFRFNKKICDFSAKFILQNPLQIKKIITTEANDNQPAIHVLRAKTSEALENILKNVSQKSTNTQLVFIIGRYNHLQQEHLHDFPNKIGNLSIEFHTAHSSKGLEADYVILIGLNGGKYGFPCQITDDNVLNLVLAKKEPFPNAEERRLFYVAVTRAKKQVFLIDDPEFNTSSFITEILRENYNIESIGHLPESHLCPICETGELIQKESNRGIFHSCSNYPFCEYIAKQCPYCDTGFLYKGKYLYKCSNKECNFKAEICPLCNEGYLIKRNNRKGGVFFGCSRFPKCRYIKPTDPTKRYAW